ncbi:glycoside hydrolase family 88 protein [Paenibacillus sp. FA6]|uniref:glycoside hydrolase family 88/105 protein n=1 Tax=Paenibacillus sp. FA6 TaxID=3413029 RepID=UPI003F65DEDF
MKGWVDDRIEDGLPKLSVNGVSVGHALITLYQATGEERYAEIIKRMADFLLNEAERFDDGVLQHTVNSEKDVFPEQAWVDTMMMAGYYQLRMGILFEREDYINDGLKQYHGHERFLQNEDTNLYYHGWDNVNHNHMSSIFWTRGNAWAALTMVKALPLIPVQNPSYMIIEGSLRDQCSALVRLQADDGLWHTVLTNRNSYTETSGSAGIAFALLGNGLFRKQVQKASEAILARIKADGTITGVSAGTAVMNDEQGYMDVPDKRIQGWGQGLTLSFLVGLARRLDK